jgi:hypothetical protein
MVPRIGSALPSESQRALRNIGRKRISAGPI